MRNACSACVNQHILKLPARIFGFEKMVSAVNICFTMSQRVSKE